MKYFLIAGEASGDLHASLLIEALKKSDADAQFRFLGGDMMARQAGVEPVIHYRRMAYMAFAEVIRHLPEILSNMRRARRAIDEFCPDAVVLIDYPSFNLKIAKYAFSKGIPVYYYISPKVWAWKEWRVRDIRRYVRRVFSILPFETEFYARHGYSVDYVGNPTANEIAAVRSSLMPFDELLRSIGIADRRPVIALLPGSRLGEIRNNLPIMYAAAARFANFQPIVAAAPSVDRNFYAQVLARVGIKANPVLVEGHTFDLVAASAAALVTSGTATLETAVLGTPQVVCYRANGSKLSYKLFERILKVRFVSLPNLIADDEVVPEMLLHRCTPDLVAERLEPLLFDSPEYRAQVEGYRRIADRLGSSDSALAAATQIIKDLQ
ncbi:MAG: lipid-A-disaccharide synthase [Candidatus Limisoma sp.]